jgi:hypothetical protein
MAQNWRAAVSIAAAIVCTACSGTVDLNSSIEDIHHARSCCATFSQLPYEQLPASNHVHFSIEQTNGAFDFGRGGLSYFRAFALPATDIDFDLVVKDDSMVENPVVSLHSYFFYPVLTVLDGNWRIIAESSVDDLMLRHGSYGANDFIAAAIHLRASQRARYVVVHTPEQMLGHFKRFSYGTNAQVNIVGRIPTVTPGGIDAYEFPGAPIATGQSLEITVLPWATSE